MAWAMVCPCAGPSASVFNTSTSRVPWSMSPWMGGVPRFGMLQKIILWKGVVKGLRDECWVLGDECWVLGAGCWVLSARCSVLGTPSAYTKSIDSADRRISGQIAWRRDAGSRYVVACLTDGRDRRAGRMRRS